MITAHGPSSGIGAFPEAGWFFALGSNAKAFEALPENDPRVRPKKGRCTGGAPFLCALVREGVYLNVSHEGLDSPCGLSVFGDVLVRIC